MFSVVLKKLLINSPILIGGGGGGKGKIRGIYIFS